MSDEKTSLNSGTLAYKLRIIQLLVFVIPSLVVFYIAYQANFALKPSDAVILVSVLVLLAAGTFLMKTTFGHFDNAARLMKKSSEEGVALESEENITAEMREIAASFNNLVRKFNNAGIDLDRKSFELNTLKEMMDIVRGSDSVSEILHLFLGKAIVITGAAHGSVLISESGSAQDASGKLLSDSERAFFLDQMKSGVEKSGKTFFYSSPSQVSIPVPVAGELVAVIYLTAQPGKEFRAEDEGVLGLMLDEVCFALENSRLNHEVRQNLKIIRERAELLDKQIQARESAQRELEVINVRFSALVQSVPDFICFKDVTGRYLLVNKSYEDLLGMEHDEIIGKKAGELFPANIAESINVSDADIIRSRLPSRFENEFHVKDRGLILDTIKTPVFSSRGELAGILVVSRDITDRKQMENLYVTLASSSPVGVYVIQDGRLRFANPKFREYAGVGEQELLGINPLDIVHPEDRDFVRENARKMLRSERTAPYEYRIATRGGDVKWIMETVIPITYGGRKAVLGNAVDFTARRSAEEALRESEQKYMELSITDDLTKLYNSRHFFTQLQIEVLRTNRYGKSLSIIIIDMDHFKQYNDCYGHLEGDKLLVRLGQVMRKCLRVTDSVYRYGGDEFIAILPETPGPEAFNVAERIRKEFLVDRSLAADQRVAVSLSIGTAQYALNEDMMDYVKRADANLYKAKENGRNQVVLN